MPHVSLCYFCPTHIFECRKIQKIIIFYFNTDDTTLDSSVGQAELTKSLKTGLPITNSPIHSVDEKEPAPITLTDSKPVQPNEKNVTTPMSTAESINAAKRPVANTPGDNNETVLATTTVAAGDQQTAKNDVALVISENVPSKQPSDGNEVALTSATKDQMEKVNLKLMQRLKY